MDPRSALLHLQELATCPYTQPNSSSPFPLTLNFLRQLLIVSSHLCLGLPSGPLTSGVPTTNLYERLFSPMPYATFLHPAHSPSFDHPNNILWALKTMKLPSIWFLQSAVISSLIDQNIILNILRRVLEASPARWGTMSGVFAHAATHPPTRTVTYRCPECMVLRCIPLSAVGSTGPTLWTSVLPCMQTAAVGTIFVV